MLRSYERKSLIPPQGRRLIHRLARTGQTFTTKSAICWVKTSLRTLVKLTGQKEFADHLLPKLRSIVGKLARQVPLLDRACGVSARYQPSQPSKAIGKSTPHFSSCFVFGPRGDRVHSARRNRTGGQYHCDPNELPNAGQFCWRIRPVDRPDTDGISAPRKIGAKFIGEANTNNYICCNIPVDKFQIPYFSVKKG